MEKRRKSVTEEKFAKTHPTIDECDEYEESRMGRVMEEEMNKRDVMQSRRCINKDEWSITHSSLESNSHARGDVVLMWRV